MWAVFVLEYSNGWDLGFLGVEPRTLTGLVGVLSMPLVHGNLSHLASNTFPLIFLGSTLFLFYDRIANRVFMQSYFVPSILVWLIGRPFYHIGASGLIYALASFLVFIGLFRKDAKSIIISLIVILVYGGLVYGVLPFNTSVSWEAHLMGGLTGLILAFNYSRRK